MHSNLTDRELVSAYLKGNDSAFEVLLKRHQDRIYSQIMILVRDEAVADDIFQETFMKAIRTLKQGKYNEEGKFLPWVLRISHNLAIDHFRKAKRMPKVRSDDNYDVFAPIKHSDKNVEDAWIEEIIHEDIRQIIEELPPEQKEVVIMRHFDDMSFKEISERCNVSINTSLGRMRYALINMRKIIDKNKITLTK